MRKLPKGMHEDSVEVTKNMLSKNRGMEEIGVMTGLEPKEIEYVQKKKQNQGKLKK